MVEIPQKVITYIYIIHMIYRIIKLIIMCLRLVHGGIVVIIFLIKKRGGVFIYWDINKILSYQRKFNFINGARSIGKTYTTLKFCINQFLKNGNEFVYIVRTKEEKKAGVLEYALKKVIENEFNSYDFSFTNEKGEIKINDNKVVFCWCVALSESSTIKKKSFSKVKYIVFDEYMIEEKTGQRYIDGFSEPNHLLSIYHTIDRESDKVIVFFLGNNTNFYNPYHLHEVFNIKKVKKGEIFKNNYCLFQWAESSDELKNKKFNTSFNKMIENSSYGSYAVFGNYNEENNNFILKLNNGCFYKFTLKYTGEFYGVYLDSKNGYIIISDKVDKQNKMVYSLTRQDNTINTMLIKSNNFHLKQLKNFFINNCLFYENQIIKNKLEKILTKLL